MSKPEIPIWNPPNSNVVEPTTLTKNTGHQEGEKPPAQYHNWLFRALSRCIQYLVPRATDAWARVIVSGGIGQILKGSGLAITGISPAGVTFTFTPAEEGDANYGVTVSSCGSFNHWYEVRAISASSFRVCACTAAGGGGTENVDLSYTSGAFTVKVMRG